jgi:uncharacterized membrane-anchored protein YhcB (DUF1043 family)
MEANSDFHSISQNEEYSNLNQEAEDDNQTVLLSFTSILERNEINIRMLKNKLKTIVEVLIPVETLSCILTDMDSNLKKLENEINQVKQVVNESFQSIHTTRLRYLQSLQQAEENLQKIIEAESKDSSKDFKLMIAQQILLGLFQNDEGKKHLIQIREHEKESLKKKAKNIGLIQTCQKNLEALEGQLKIISKTEAMEKKFLDFQVKILDIYKFQQEVRTSINSIENSQIIDLEDLNSTVVSLIATFKTFQSFYLEVATIRSELSKKEKIIAINEKIGEISVDIAAEEAFVELLNVQEEELSNELEEKVKDLSFCTAQDLVISGIFPKAVEVEKNQVVDEEKVFLKEAYTSTDDGIFRQRSVKKSAKTLKVEFEINRLKQQLKKVENQLSNKRELQEQLDQMVSFQQRLENESFAHFNTINSQLAKTCEKYQILINQMSRSRNTFTPETTTALIGTLCSFLTIAPKPSFFSCEFFKYPGIKSKITLTELYKQLSKKINEKSDEKFCIFSKNSIDLVHDTSSLELNEIINLLFNNELLGCIKTEKKMNGIDLVTVEDIYSQLVQLIKKLSEIIVIQRQLQVKINCEENLKVLNCFKQEAVLIIRELGYIKIADRLEGPNKIKKIRIAGYFASSV